MASLRSNEAKKIFLFQKNTLCQCVLPNIMSCKCPSEHNEMCPSEHNAQKVSFRTKCHIQRQVERQNCKYQTSSKSFPYPKGEKNGHRRWPYMQVLIIFSQNCNFILRRTQSLMFGRTHCILFGETLFEYCVRKDTLDYVRKDTFQNMMNKTF